MTNEELHIFMDKRTKLKVQKLALELRAVIEPYKKKLPTGTLSGVIFRECYRVTMRPGDKLPNSFLEFEPEVTPFSL